MRAVSPFFSDNATLFSARFLSLVTVSGLLAVVLPAMPVVATTATPPPIIDRELFFGDPEIVGAQISPDGEFIAFVKPVPEL